MGLELPQILIRCTQYWLILWQKRHVQDFLLAVMVTLIPELAKQKLYCTVSSYAKDVIDIKIEEMIAHEEYVYQSGPADTNKWNLKWVPLQGKYGLWFNGDAFSGSGSPPKITLSCHSCKQKNANVDTSKCIFVLRVYQMHLSQSIFFFVTTKHTVYQQSRQSSFSSS